MTKTVLFRTIALVRIGFAFELRVPVPIELLRRVAEYACPPPSFGGHCLYFPGLSAPLTTFPRETMYLPNLLSFKPPWKDNQEQSTVCGTQDDTQNCRGSAEDYGPKIKQQFLRELGRRVRIPPRDFPEGREKNLFTLRLIKKKKKEFVNSSCPLQSHKKISHPSPSFFLPQSFHFLEHMVLKVLAS